jgi:serine O-acetyltransferase
MNYIKCLKKYFMFAMLPIFLPLLLLFYLSNQRALIKGDLARWKAVQRYKGESLLFFLLLQLKNPVSRAIYFHRLKCGNVAGWFLGEILSRIYRPLPTLSIHTRDIGPGLFIQHGCCTIIAAKKIGANVWINQGVTIGYTNDTDTPTIGDNVTISAGAKVLGNIFIGDNVKIGANAVVVKNVPSNTTVVGVPARIVRRDGKRVLEDL